MLRKIYSTTVLTFVSFIFLHNLSAQELGQTTLYSYYGIGQDINVQSVAANQMGGIGAVNTDLRNFTLSNPSLLSNIRLTNYTLASEAGQIRQSNSVGGNQHSNFLKLSYFALAFPFGKSAGMSFGVRRSSTVGYEFSTGSSEKGLRLYQGVGGINDAFLSTGFRVKQFSFGVEATYRFGLMTHLNTFRQKGVQYHSRLRKELLARGFQFRYGFNHQLPVSKKIILVSSVVVEHSLPLKLSQSNYFYKGIFFGMNSEDIQRQFPKTTHSGTYNAPLKTTLGIALTKFLYWNIGATYSFRKAVSFSGDVWSFNQDNFRYETFQRFAFGGAFSLDPTAIKNYWKSVTYRAGVFYEKTGKRVYDTSINSMGLSVGLGLPLGKSRLCHLDAGLSYVQIGKNLSKIVKENQFKITFAISFAGQWFYKRKID